jgi:hypothetical protein
MNRFMTTTVVDKVLNLVIDGNEEDIRDTDSTSTHLTIYDLFYLDQIKNIRSILPWFLIVFGLMGNMLILVVFLKKSRRSTSSGFCFVALAISDSIALIFMLLRSLLNLQILGNVSLACKFIKFIYYSSLQISSWCLVLLTFDRLIAVLFIFRYNTWSKKLHALKLLILIVFVILLINMHLLIFVSSKVRQQDETIYPKNRLIKTTTKLTVLKPNKQPRYVCYCDQKEFPLYYRFIYSKWDVYHSIIYGALPFLIILASNIAIILKLTILKNKSFRKTPVNSSINKTRKYQDLSSDSIKSKQITIMLLSIAFIYLLLTSPVSFYMAFLYENLTSVRESKREYVKVILRYIAYFNNAINFYIYFSLSSEFRRELINSFKKMLKIKKSVTLCTTTTTLGSNDVLNAPISPRDNGMLPTPPKRFIYNRNIDDSNSSSQPFLSKDQEVMQSNNAVEKYKLDNRNAKLFYYKSDSKYRNNDSEKFRKLNNAKDNYANSNTNSSIVDDNKPFVSPYATLV